MKKVVSSQSNTVTTNLDRIISLANDLQNEPGWSRKQMKLIEEAYIKLSDAADPLSE